MFDTTILHHLREFFKAFSQKIHNIFFSRRISLMHLAYCFFALGGL